MAVTLAVADAPVRTFTYSWAQALAACRRIPPDPPSIGSGDDLLGQRLELRGRRHPAVVEKFVHL